MKQVFCNCTITNEQYNNIDGVPPYNTMMEKETRNGDDVHEV